MARKPKFTKEEITSVALELVKKEGIESLTARRLGKELKSSSCPIFTVFENMEEVQQEVIKAAKACYKEYIEKGLKDKLAFRGVGIQYIVFALKETRLFQLLFMNEQTKMTDINYILPLIDESYDLILDSIIQGYDISKEKAEVLYRHLWIYSHGIATLCANKMCSFSKDEIEAMLTEVFISLLKMLKEFKR